ncbi:MAG: GlsB/YeaQ/YmgE family stress response membrane protein [Gemmatimonadetes bacterium]|nr:GlsB/YeaQ/YmgE family stress response membrane protein [Gemmatimonadota bacterium]
MLLGVGGAWVGGFLGSVLGLGSVTGFNFWSMALAVGGALVILWISKKLKSD